MPSPCVHLILGGHILHTTALNRTGAGNLALTDVGTKWKVHRGCLSSHALTFGCLWVA